ncbi:Tyrocidine synthase 3 [Synechococcus sp. CBW1107]|nr:Tyrocidine synthase 3 [Synechococcus sp. CBW1107]
MHQLEPELTAYHLRAVWRLRGDLDVPALQRALEGLIERHSTLRTSFLLQGSEVIQIVHPASPFALTGEALGERDPEVVIREWLEEENRTPFDLTAGQLLRARLLVVDSQHHLLLVNHHHIASDGWSLSILARDLVELYNAERAGRSPQLEPFCIHYPDYGVWQRQRLSGDRLQKLNDYWISQLRNLEPLELPTDHPRPAMPSHRGRCVEFTIEPQLLEPFEELCRREGATLQMGLLAVVALLLHRTSRQDEVAIGVPFWGRNHPELENLIGFFINTLPIRTRFQANQTFRDLLRQVKEASIAAYDHQELPFEQMVEALNVERDTSRNPLVQVMLQLMELPEAGLEQLDGLAVQSLSSGSDSAKLDLSFYLFRSADQGLSASITYAMDLFDGDRIERLSTHLINLLSSVLKAPDQPAATLNLLPEPERQLIESWQQGPVVEVPELCVHELFEQQVERTPEAIALVFGDQEITYSELNARANQLAHHLIDLGVSAEVIVGVCLERSVELIVALLAILKAGGTFLPLDPSWPQERIKAILEQAGDPLLIALSANQDPRSAQQHCIPLSDRAHNTSNTHRLPHSSVQLDQPAYLLFTSGSTGQPKGVLVGHRALTERCKALTNQLPVGIGDRILALTTPVFDISFLELLIPLTQGASIAITPAAIAKDLSAISRHCESAQITLLQATPFALEALIHSGYKPTPGITILAGGEVLTQNLADQLTSSGATLINGYGPSEATIYTSLARINQHAPVSIGTPFPGTTVRVLDPSGHPCPIGIPGELHIGGAGLAHGYFNNPGLTAEKFIPDPFSSDPTARLYKSGDLASWNADGTLAFHGRLDQQIKLRGFRIEPGEIEAHLLAHPAVAQAVVVLRKDDPANPRLIAYWVPQEATLSTPVSDAAIASAGVPGAEQLRVFLAERLPDYMVPAAFVELEALPLTTNGKLDRKALPTPSFSGDVQQRVEPSTDLESQLHALWAEVLGHGEFGISDNFFLVGGHSLAAAGLVSRIEQILGSALPLAALFQNPTIAGLVPLLVGSSGVAESSAAILPAAPLPGDWPPVCEAHQASFAQARLWFLHQLEPELTAYHLPAVWHLRGDLDVAALEQALEGLIERHSTLRTSFLLQRSEVIQIVHPASPFALASEALGEGEPEAVIREWLEEESRTPFDLTGGLLLRARLLAVDSQHHLLLVNHHHIASDGWSLSLLTRDLTELYNAHHSKRSPQLKPLSVHYQDYAAWQRQRLSGERLQELNDYWIGQLRNLEPLELPSDHPRPAMPSHRGRCVEFTIEPQLLEPFEELCRREGATLQMGLLAVVALLLHRTSRQDEVAIGVPFWGRNHPELENLIGFFINTLPIRTRFQANQTFRDLLRQVKEASIAAYDHQELPFEQMVEALNVERDTSRNPLVQVMLQLMELPEAGLEQLDGLAVQSLSSGSDSAKLDLSFYLFRSADQGLSASITYAMDLFDGDRIERLSTHLINLLSSVLKAPDQPAATLNLLPEPERQLIESWQQGPVVEVPELCVHELFEQQVERTPEAIALVFGDQEITYSELNARANQLAHHLIDLGVSAEVIVGVCLERSVELIVALLAILKAGGAYLPLDLAWPEERQHLLLEEAGCTLLLTAEGPEVIHSPHPVRGAVSGPPLAYVTYTSGSTGIPKGVAVGHPSILRLVNPVNGYQLSVGHRVLQLAPMAFDASTLEIWGPLLNGGTLVIAPPGQLSLQELAEVLRQGRITTLWLTAGLFHAMVESELEALAGVRQVLAGGDVLAPEHVQRLLDAFPAGHMLINGYGPTENTTFTCCHRLAAGDTVDPAGVAIGRPIALTSLQVLGPSGQPCPIGIPGELHIGGAGLAHGYFNNPGLTAEKFIPDPFSSDPTARLYKSGDLASWNADGTLAFHGRLDEQIKLRGFRIEPGEIEAHLLAHPAVAQAVVVLRKDDPANPRLIAYWVPQEATLSTPVSDAAIASAGVPGAEQLRVFLAERLPDYMVPAAFVELEALPLTTNGKLDRKALPTPSFSGDVQQRVEPSTDLESQLHALWAEVLGHGEFGISDNFFLVGGHSLAAAGLVSRIEQILGSALPLAALFQNPTIAGLVPLLVGSSGVAESSAAILPAAPLPGDWPPVCEAHQASFAQARLWFLHQLEPELTAYHLPAVWHLRGDLDVAALEQALEGLIERHSTLRTSFLLQRSEVIQIVHPASPFALASEALGEGEPEAVIREWLEEESRTPFDLTGGLLLRARLLAVDSQHHLLLVNHHHIASDGWSLSLLTRDLTELYNAHHSKRSPQLKPLSVHYQDYAAWQRQRLSGERLQELNDYWIGQLRNLEPLELPSDHPRPAMPSHRGRCVEFTIEPQLLEPFEELCRREGATLQMGLLAVVALLLHRTSRQDEVAIGVPFWGRNHPELENLIGFFINTLPIRTRFQANQTFRDLLRQVKEASIAAYDHQELPFEQMVEALNVERDTSRNPLVQVMLQLMELPEAGLEQLDGLAVQSLSSGSDSAKLDLSFYLFRSADQGLSASITYAMDLFDGDRIERLSTHLINLLSSVLKAPDQPAATLNLLPEPERQLIESWQQGPVVEVPELCVHELFEQQVERTPEAIALVFGDQEITYSELNARANQLAHHLIDLGVSAEVIVGVCLERSVELIVALLAILKAGGAYLPLDLAWPEERQHLLLEEAGCTLLLTAEGPEVIHSPHPVRGAVSGPPLAYVTYTSGSTGIPKGVAVGHPSILRLVNPVNGYQLSVGHRVLQLAPMAFDASTLEIWGPLLNGGTLVIAPPGQLSLQELAEVLRQGRITTLWLTAGLFHAMVESELEALAGVRQVLAGGDVLAPEHVQRLLDAFPAGHMLINGYGPTENTTFTCCHRLAAGDTVDPAGVAIGRPIALTSLQVLGPSGQPCPIGIPGELHIGGAGLAHGYFNNPGLTAEKFIPDPFSSDPTARLYKSGDLASWNADGTLAFHGRLDEQIKLRGFRIEPGEIEAHLLAHPAVAQAVVVLRKDDPANPRLIAYWVPQEATLSTPVSDAAIASAGVPGAEQLRVFLAERLPDYMVPAAFVELEALPLTTNGKLDRKALPTPSFSGDVQQRVEPSTDLESQLHALWAEVLGHGEFGISDNFFLVGGHSLAAAGLVSRIEQILGSALPLAALFQNPTIAGLVPLLVGSSGVAESSAAILPAAPLPGDWPPVCEAHQASFAQARLWFLHQLEPELTAYHLPAVWHLRGDLDVAALEQALEGLIERHSTLRTSFLLQRSEVIQIVHPASPFALASEALGEGEPEAVIREWLEEESRTPFDLTGGLLLRARLLAVDSQHHLLLVNHHHIASDGWSLSLLTRDLTELYNAHHSKRSPQLKPLSVHYQDYAAWQRQRLSGERLQELNDYWIGQLRNLEPLELPSDHPRPAMPSHRGRCVEFTIEPQLLEPFEELCRREGATLQMGLLAVVALLLHRTSRQDEVAIGVPFWGRNHPELENLIGFFINTLPIRTRFQANQTFRDLLRQVKEASIAAYDHQELPFEQMVEALNVERDTSRNPLVQVMLQLIELPEATLQEMQGLEVEIHSTKSESSKLDLSFYLHRTANRGLHCLISYASDLFNADRIQRLSSHLLTLLSSALLAPDVPIKTLTLLPEAEHLLIESWQQGPTIDVPDLCVHKLFEQQVERTPDAIALIFQHQQLTYCELNARANQLAHYLNSLGVGPDLIVALCLERSVELIVALLAILKAGGAYLPMPSKQPPARLLAILRDSRPAWVLTSDQLLGAFEQDLPSDIGVIKYSDLILSHSLDHNLEASASPSDLAYVLYTSGTTGSPKGVTVSHNALVNRCSIYPQVWELDHHARVLAQSEFGFDNSTREWLLPLTCGASVVLASEQQQQEAEQLLGLLESHCCTHLAATPSRLEMLIGIKSLQGLIVTAGGERLSPILARQILSSDPRRLMHSFGSTETCLAIAYHDLTPPESEIDSDRDFSAIPIGRPLPNTCLLVLDPAGMLCPIGIPGELHIGGAGLARGYLNNPELTEEKFIRDPFSTDPTARLYKSGDLASWNPDGTLAFHGRLDQLIKLRGFRIEPEEIEAALIVHPSIEQAIVLLRQDQPSNPQLVAYWIAAHPSGDSTGSVFSSAELRPFLARSLPDYMLPAAFVRLEALPLTPNGKLDRKALPAPSFSGNLQQRVEPSTELELQLHALWAEVLGHSDFGITDNFFLMGGHSLAATRLVSRIEQTLGSAPPLAALFHNPTIAALEPLLHASSGNADRNDTHLSTLIPLQTGGTKPPLFFMPGYGGHPFGHILCPFLDAQQPVYSFMSRGLDGKQIPHTRLEDMAADYVRDLRTLQAEGPYFLAGYSFGTRLAFEVAQQLYHQRQQVAFLALIDSAASLSRAPSRIAGNSPPLLSVKEASLFASRTYTPQYYAGKITLFRAEESIYNFLPEGTGGWGELALGGIEIHDYPGRHALKGLAIQRLGEKLRVCLEKAQAIAFQSPRRPQEIFLAEQDYSPKVAQDTPLYYRYLSREYLKKADLEREIGSYQKAIKLDPRQPDWVYRNLGDALIEEGRLDEAITIYHDGLMFHPFNPKLYESLSAALTKGGESEQALNCWKKAIALNPALAFGNVYNQDGNDLKPERLTMALSAYQEAVSVHSQFLANIYKNLGLVQSQNGELKKAIASYRQGISLSPEFVPLYISLGWALIKEGKLEGAFDTFQEVIGLDSHREEAYLGLGALRRQQGNVQEAIVNFQKAIELSPNHAGANKGLGDCFRDLGKVDEAITAYGKAIQINPNNPEFYIGLALAERKQGNVQEAIVNFQKAIELSPNHAGANKGLGDCFRDLGKVDEAITAYGKAIQINPNNPEFYIGLALAERKQGNVQEAIVNFQKAIELSPNHAGANKGLGDCFRDLGKVDEAITA